MSGGPELHGYDTDAEIEEAVHHISDARAASRGCSEESRPSSLVPDGAIDECEESHRATKCGKQSASKTDTFCSKGLMATICRHDIPLFLCNVRTLGEQQHFQLPCSLHLAANYPQMPLLD
jgi:hypothetical protein